MTSFPNLQQDTCFYSNVEDIRKKRLKHIRPVYQSSKCEFGEKQQQTKSSFVFSHHMGPFVTSFWGISSANNYPEISPIFSRT